MSSVGQFQARASEASTGYELRCTDDQKDEGIFATRPFKRQELVIKGNILESDIKNNSHASQVGVNKFVLNDELLTKINIRVTQTVGFALTKTVHANMSHFAILKLEKSLLSITPWETTQWTISRPSAAVELQSAVGVLKAG